MNYQLSGSYHTLNHWQSGGGNASAWNGKYVDFDNLQIQGLAINGKPYLFPYVMYENGYNSTLKYDNYALLNDEIFAGERSGRVIVDTYNKYGFAMYGPIETYTVGDMVSWSNFGTTVDDEVTFTWRELNHKNKHLYEKTGDSTLTITKDYTGGALRIFAERYEIFYLVWGVDDDTPATFEGVDETDISELTDIDTSLRYWYRNPQNICSILGFDKFGYQPQLKGQTLINFDGTNTVYENASIYGGSLSAQATDVANEYTLWQTATGGTDQVGTFGLPFITTGGVSQCYEYTDEEEKHDYAQITRGVWQGYSDEITRSGYTAFNVTDGGGMLLRYITHITVEDENFKFFK